mmetsp:Transcript_29715/g.92854  ORF Transcript_29715/g.92854 Transcript_29715/m.92854 type:complete len:265 (-) Transcript_29715:52-846(-)
MALLQEIWHYPALQEQLTRVMGTQAVSRFKAASRSCFECMRRPRDRRLEKFMSIASNSSGAAASTAHRRHRSPVTCDISRSPPRPRTAFEEIIQQPQVSCPLSHSMSADVFDTRRAFLMSEGSTADHGPLPCLEEAAGEAVQPIGGEVLERHRHRSEDAATRSQASSMVNEHKTPRQVSEGTTPRVKHAESSGRSRRASAEGSGAKRGRLVRLRNLQTRPDLNGTLGRLLHYAPSSNRCEVFLLSTREAIRTFPRHIELVSAKS